VAGQPHFLVAQPSPVPFSARSFPVAFYSLTDQCSYYGMVKFCAKEGFSPFKSLNSSPSPSLLFQNSCSSSPLPWIPSMLHPPLRCKEDPAVERGITHQGHIMCVDRIDRPTEGLRCCKRGHWRSRHTIGEDGRSVGHGLWPIGPP
jgi:hypothetical protein